MPAPSNRLALPTGYQLGEFRIDRVLGKGGFGITYLATDQRQGARVAIKELLPDGIATRISGETVVAQTTAMEPELDWALKNFEIEARTLATFKHPNIVQVHRLIHANGTAYLVMDYVDGVSLGAAFRARPTPPDPAWLMPVVDGILDGLQEVHARGHLHRDIKPANIIVTEDGKPVLLDFGAARADLGRTITMTAMVSHGYSPFEQYQTKARQGAFTDIYSTAAVLYRGLTGSKPPNAADRMGEDECRRLAKSAELIRAGYGKPFLAATDHGLKVDAKDRPQSVWEWRQALKTNFPSVPSTQPKTFSILPAIAVLLMLTALILIGVLILKKRAADGEEAGSGDLQIAGAEIQKSIREGQAALADFEFERAESIAQQLLSEHPRNGDALDLKKATSGMLAIRDYEDGYGDSRRFIGIYYQINRLAQMEGRPDYSDYQLQALFWRGKLRLLGDGVTQDLDDGFADLERAAEENFDPARFELARRLFVGMGTTENPARALSLLDQAAETEPEAMRFLAWLHRLGEFVNHDPTKAETLERNAFRRAESLASRAEGDWASRYGLLHSHYYGLGTPEDRRLTLRLASDLIEDGSLRTRRFAAYYAMAERRYSAATTELETMADMGSRGAVCLLGLLYELGQHPQGEDLKEAFGLYRESLNSGSAAAMSRVAGFYRPSNDHSTTTANDLVGGSNAAAALDLCEKSFEKGFPGAAFYIGDMYLNGVTPGGVDLKSAYDWTFRASILGDSAAVAQLGTFYHPTGIDWAVERNAIVGGADAVKAARLYENAADLGNTFGMGKMGYLFLSGNHPDGKDLRKSFNWYKKAADAGSAEGMRQVATFYDPADSSEKHEIVGGADKNQAANWFEKAANAGDPYSMFKMGHLYEFGGHPDGINQNEARAWYQKAVDAGFGSAAEEALNRL